MKYLLVAVITVGLKVPSFAAVAPADFAGVPWGASFDDATKAIQTKGAKFERKAKEGEADTLSFSGGTFAGRAVDHWVLFFEDNQFRAARLQLKPEGKAETQFRTMKSALSGTYGTANDKQVATRRPPRFVLGLGWRHSGADKAPLSARWLASSGLDQRTVEIKCWLEHGSVRLEYVSDSGRKSTPGKTPPRGSNDL